MSKKTSNHIRPANADDINAICEIEKQCFPGEAAYTKRQLAYLVQKANGTSLVETCDGTVRAFVIVLYKKGSHVGSIETINVDPKYRTHGIGLRLLAAAEDKMSDRGMSFSQLEVSEGNKVAINLYTRAGYRQKKILKNYYRLEHNGTHDAIRMIKPLSGSK